MLQSVLLNVLFFQLQINNFSSSTTSDWVEIVNQSDSDVNFNEYRILDVAGNEISKDILLPAKGNCVFDYSNRLNNKGDVIYLKKGEDQIDCIKYGDGAGGECEVTRDPTEEKPSSSCFQKTPEPTASPTPAPTVVLTSDPKSRVTISTEEVLPSIPSNLEEKEENVDEGEVLAKQTVLTPMPRNEEQAFVDPESVEENEAKATNYFAWTLILSGGLTMLSAIIMLTRHEFLH